MEEAAGSVREHKVRQRLAALETRRRLEPEKRRQREQTVCTLLEQMPEVLGARSILSYLATEEEMSLDAFHGWARREGKTVSFPVSRPGGSMDAYVPASPEDMRKGLFGILEPEPDSSVLLRPEEIDLVLVPCVAFDAEGRRLGHGGGYYDRYLPGCIRASVVLVAYEAQRLSRVATDELDVSVDTFVTERGVTRVRVGAKEET